MWAARSGRWPLSPLPAPAGLPPAVLAKLSGAIKTTERKLAEGTLHHGDSRDVLPDLPTASVDAIVTDPPYSSGGMFRGDREASPDAKYRGWSQNPDGSSRKPSAEYGTFGGDSRDQRSFMLWVSAWSFGALRATRPGG